MAERFLHMRKITASDRRCLSQGKTVMRTDDGKVYCGKKTILRGKELKRAKTLLEKATVERLKSFLELKKFHGYSHLPKQKLINLVFHHTDPHTGDVILRTPKSSRKSKSKESRRKGSRKKSKESRRKHRSK
jgi:hypothetical protein